ncbi:hypothetical protein GDO78_009595 [Eleutherodactylus coqui]|uniref:Uncharacterized protein n=1 Tax=Eleutherodactylus coqui TaxID=57060 RepID=A0A8J6F8Z8_ELECQ|nr:hypothetical protein GDO78_009595 [Eleutherodactylus coqui]
MVMPSSHFIHKLWRSMSLCSHCRFHHGVFHIESAVFLFFCLFVFCCRSTSEFSLESGQNGHADFPMHLRVDPYELNSLSADDFAHLQG